MGDPVLSENRIGCDSSALVAYICIVVCFLFLSVPVFVFVYLYLCICVFVFVYLCICICVFVFVYLCCWIGTIMRRREWSVEAV